MWKPSPSIWFTLTATTVTSSGETVPFSKYFRYFFCFSSSELRTRSTCCSVGSGRTRPGTRMGTESGRPRSPDDAQTASIHMRCSPTLNKTSGPGLEHLTSCPARASDTVRYISNQRSCVLIVNSSSKFGSASSQNSDHIFSQCSRALAKRASNRSPLVRANSRTVLSTCSEGCRRTDLSSLQLCRVSSVTGSMRSEIGNGERADQSLRCWYSRQKYF